MERALEGEIRRAAEAIAKADALFIGAGAGMGVDSGLPDFRGPQGFWRAYPPYEKLGLGFTDLASPRWFAKDPAFGWGFYGHRRNLYRATAPHRGFEILRRWCGRMSRGYWVFTSNVDHHFQRAGFDPRRVVEVHGSIEWCQCTDDCGEGPFPAGPEDVAIDESTMRAVGPLPACPGCGALARPNILMFGDYGWDPARFDEARARVVPWLEGLDGAKVAVVEFGAGPSIPTVRLACEGTADELRGTLIRVNPRDPEVSGRRHIALPIGALEAITAIASSMAGG
jgi:NAD-dependent SIR2 family protein deacetylase